MDFHPVSEIFPLMQGKVFEDLVEDIRQNGLREPIWLLGDKIIDGRNRYRACEASGVTPHYNNYVGDEAGLVAFVVSLNLHRRHLNESQRAMVAANLANIGNGQHSSANLHSTTSGEAAEMLNVSERSVATARKVRDTGADELIEAVQSGSVSVNAAQDVATLPKEEQAEIVARGEKEILQAAKEIRAEKAKTRRAERIEKIAEISQGNTELGTDRKYPIIYADPPWRYENPPMGDTGRSIENHYPTMELEEICRLPVADLATPDALLYMWATAPKLAECIQVVEAWGFEYRTCFVWVKDKIGMGYYARNQHEILMVCRRGELPPPDVSARYSSVVHADRTEHSAKPVEFYEIIESAYPELPKIELFSRSPREGWAAWGNQAEVA